MALQISKASFRFISVGVKSIQEYCGIAVLGFQLRSIPSAVSLRDLDATERYNSVAWEKAPLAKCRAQFHRHFLHSRSKLARVVVEKVEGTCCCVDAAHSRVGAQQKERDVAGFNLQKSPRSASVLSSASQDVFVLK